MNCHDIQHQFYPFLDGELETEQHQAIERHLADCSSCQAGVERVGALEDRLRTAFQDEAVPEALWSRIQTNLEATEAVQPPIKLSRRMATWGWVATAAVLVLAVSVMVFQPPWLPRSRQAQLLSIPVEDLHTFVASQRGLDVSSTGSEQVRQWFWERVDFSPPALPVKVGKAQLIGGRLCHFLDRRVAAFMYQAEGHYLAVNVMPRQGLTLPIRGDGVLETPRGTIHEVKGYTHILWSRSDLLYSMVSDLPQEQLADVAKALAGQSKL